jgi:transcription elongation factor Elf1
VPDDITRFTCSYCGSALVLEQGEGYVAARLAEQVTAEVRQVGAELGNKLDDIEAALDVDTGDRTLHCPSCGRADAVRKVTAIVEAETANVTVRGSRGAAQSVLAQKLRFPLEKPIVSDPISWSASLAIGAAVLAFGIFIFAISAATLPNTMDSAFDMLMSCAVIGGVFLVLAWRLHRPIPPKEAERRERQSNDYKTALQRYDDVYYCTRCDLVFVPGDTRSAPAADLISLLK